MKISSFSYEQNLSVYRYKFNGQWSKTEIVYKADVGFILLMVCGVESSLLFLAA